MSPLWSGDEVVEGIKRKADAEWRESKVSPLSRASGAGNRRETRTEKGEGAPGGGKELVRRTRDLPETGPAPWGARPDPQAGRLRRQRPRRGLAVAACGRTGVSERAKAV